MMNDQDRTHSSVARRLAAILFADIVGYTGMMQFNEQHALQTIQKYQSILSSSARQSQGRILKNYGDGSLMIFQNSLDAVQAAEKIQEQCGQDIPLRIGIHVGEFVVRDNDIYGNGVNLASRLESLGVAGSILFSGEVYRKIKNHPELEVKSLGRFRFKNVEEAMEVFALANRGLVVPKRSEMEGKLKDSAKAKLTKPLIWLMSVVGLVLAAVYFLSTNNGQDNIDLNSAIPRIAVLDFATTGNTEKNQLTTGITKELIQRLAGLRNLGVISYQSVAVFTGTAKTLKQIGKELQVDYVMGGEVNWSDLTNGTPLLTIAPRLLRVVDNKLIWSQAFKREISETSTLQTELTNELLKQLDVVLTSDEQYLLKTAPTKNSLAYQAYLKGLRVKPDSHGTEKDFRAAFRMFEQALQLDPDFIQANLQLGVTYMDLYWFGYENGPTAMDSALRYFRKAQQINPDLKELAYYFGDYYYRLRQYDKSLKEFSKIIDDRPNDVSLLQRIGELWRRQGLFDQAIETLEKALRLDPYNANSMTELAWTYIFVSNFPRALELNERSKEVDPEAEWNYLMGAFIHWTRGEEGDLTTAPCQYRGLLFTAHPDFARLQNIPRFQDLIERQSRMKEKNTPLKS